MNKKYIIIGGLIAVIALCLVYKSNTGKQNTAKISRDKSKAVVNNHKAVVPAPTIVQKNNPTRSITNQADQNTVNEPTSVAF